jgi:hypothetical protein
LDVSTFSEVLSTLDLTSTAKINFGTGGTLAFATSSGVDWTGGTLHINGNFVSGSSLRFGTNASGLTSSQLALISIPGFSNVALNGSGYVIATSTGTGLYATWSGGAPFQMDTNLDGIPNGIAWVLGADTVSHQAASLQPTGDLTTDPAYFTFTYRRRDAAHTAPGVSIIVQYTNDLGQWTAAVHDGNNIIISATDEIGPGIDSVQVKIKRTLLSGDQVFARLRVEFNP